MNMNFEILTRQPITFYEKQGIKFFEPFNAVDNFKKPLQIFMDTKHETPFIRARNYQDETSLYELNFNLQNKELKGVSLVAEPKNNGIGETLNLAALIEFAQNRLNKFNIYSFKETMQFYAHYGFNIMSKDINYILSNLNLIIQSKEKSMAFDNIRRSAKFFYKRVQNHDIQGRTFDDTLFWANKVMSNYLRELSKSKIKFKTSNMLSGSDMLFTDWERLTNTNHLNELFDKHEINFRV